MIAFLIFERRVVRGSWWLPVAGLLLFGVSVGLPLLLYLREPSTVQKIGSRPAV